MSRDIKHGSTDQSTVLRFVDITTGEPETGVVAATAGLALWYRLEGGAKVAIGSLSDLAAVDSAHTDGGIKHISDGNVRVDLPDAACASSAGVLVGGSATGMVVIPSYHALVANVEADTYARLGAPAGASTAADIAAVKADTAAVLLDTGTDGVVVAAGAKTGYSLAADQSAVTVGAVSGAVGSVTGNVAGSVGSLAAQAQSDVTASVPTASAVAAAVLGYVTSGSRTLQEVVALIEALVGVRTGVSSSPGSVVIKNPEGNKTRATATSDGAGNVSAVSIGDLTP